jgi:hypothetical protein
MIRRSCSCGAGMTADGADRIALAGLVDDWDEAHTGPGHEPIQRPLSKEGRAPRRRPTSPAAGRRRMPKD